MSWGIRGLWAIRTESAIYAAISVAMSAAMGGGFCGGIRDWAETAWSEIHDRFLGGCFLSNTSYFSPAYM
jgi:hypothetical protein